MLWLNLPLFSLELSFDRWRLELYLSSHQKKILTHTSGAIWFKINLQQLSLTAHLAPGATLQSVPPTHCSVCLQASAASYSGSGTHRDHHRVVLLEFGDVFVPSVDLCLVQGPEAAHHPHPALRCVRHAAAGSVYNTVDTAITAPLEENTHNKTHKQGRDQSTVSDPGKVRHFLRDLQLWGLEGRPLRPGPVQSSHLTTARSQIIIVKVRAGAALLKFRFRNRPSSQPRESGLPRLRHGPNPDRPQPCAEVVHAGARGLRLSHSDKKMKTRRRRREEPRACTRSCSLSGGADTLTGRWPVCGDRARGGCAAVEAEAEAVAASSWLANRGAFPVRATMLRRAPAACISTTSISVAEVARGRAHEIAALFRNQQQGCVTGQADEHVNAPLGW